MINIYWTDNPFSPFYDGFNQYNWSPFTGGILDDSVIALFMAIFIWFCFSLLKNMSDLLRYSWIVILGVFSYYIANVFWKTGLIRPISRRINQFSVGFRDMGLRGMRFLENLGRGISLKFMSWEMKDDMMFYLSEICAVIFLLLILLIFFILTRCNSDRPFTSFIFRDFLFICFLCVIFLLYAIKFKSPKLVWPSFTYRNYWTDWNPPNYVYYF